MADPFVAEIRIVPFNFTPKGWAACDGQLMPLSQNTALFSLLGTTYGGDGKSTFALPDLQGRTPLHPGQGPGLSLRDLGEAGGSATVTLLEAEIPAHTHAARANDEALGLDSGAGNSWGAVPRLQLTKPYAGGTPNAVMNSAALAPVGGDAPHNNRQPYLGLNFIIALQGVFPPRG